MAEVHLTADGRRELQAELAACLARATTIAALLSGDQDVPASAGAENDNWPDYPEHPDLVTPDVAAKRASVDATTMQKWCEIYNIGKIYGKRWRVSLTRLRAYLAA